MPISYMGAGDQTQVLMLYRSHFTDLAITPGTYLSSDFVPSMSWHVKGDYKKALCRNAACSFTGDLKSLAQMSAVVRNHKSGVLCVQLS